MALSDSRSFAFMRNCRAKESQHCIDQISWNAKNHSALFEVMNLHWTPNLYPQPYLHPSFSHTPYLKWEYFQQKYLGGQFAVGWGDWGPREARMQCILLIVPRKISFSLPQSAAGVCLPWSWLPRYKSSQSRIYSRKLVKCFNAFGSSRRRACAERVLHFILS